MGNFWFYEANATWCAVVHGWNSDEYDRKITEFLIDPLSINFGDGYEAVLLPLTIYKAYGGTNTIRKMGDIWYFMG